jgi:hypothetical protein
MSFRYIIQAKQNLHQFTVQILTDVIYETITKNINSKIIECVGPEVITF